MLSIKELLSKPLVIAASATTNTSESPTPEVPSTPTPKVPEKPRDKPKFGAGKKGSRPQPPPMNKSLRPRRR